MDTFDVRNPVIQRLTSNNGALRNESYYKVSLMFSLTFRIHYVGKSNIFELKGEC